MTIKVKVDEQDIIKLERLHYLNEAKANLITRMAGDETKYNNNAYEKLMNDYYETYKEYSLYKEEIDVKYRPKEYLNSAKSWTANFLTKELEYEVE